MKGGRKEPCVSTRWAVGERCLKNLPEHSPKKWCFLADTIYWRQRYVAHGLVGLQDHPRSGRPLKYGKQFRDDLLKVLRHSPPKGLAVWDGPAVAEELGVPVDAVWKALRKEGINLQRHRSWCISTDTNFASKAADIVGLY